jgi:peptide deformylase
MGDTLRAVNAIGLSAVQIGIPKRVVLLRNGMRLHQLINPVIIGESGAQLVTEEMSQYSRASAGKVGRPKEYLSGRSTAAAKTVFLRGQGFLAPLSVTKSTLDGVLFIDRAVPGTLVRSRY